MRSYEYEEDTNGREYGVGGRGVGMLAEMLSCLRKDIVDCQWLMG